MSNRIIDGKDVHAPRIQTRSNRNDKECSKDNIRTISSCSSSFMAADAVVGALVGGEVLQFVQIFKVTESSQVVVVFIIMISLTLTGGLIGPEMRHTN